MQVFFSVMVGAMQLGQAGPNFEAIATAQGAAYQVFNVIDRVGCHRSFVSFFVSFFLFSLLPSIYLSLSSSPSLPPPFLPSFLPSFPLPSLLDPSSFPFLSFPFLLLFNLFGATAIPAHVQLSYSRTL